MIHVRRSFHGARATAGSGNRCGGGGGGSGGGYEGLGGPVFNNNCTYCPGDCVDETAAAVYDWAACSGRQACSRTVLQSLMPHCSRGGQQQVPGGVTPARTESPPPPPPGDSQTNDIAAHSVTWEHFSDYVSVDYDCINRTIVVLYAFLPRDPK